MNTSDQIADLDATLDELRHVVPNTWKKGQELMTVHPAADIFPMMSEEDLADLAEDIKANGQIHPIVLDADGQLIDGRNRLKACELAGVKPKFEKLNGHDPLAYIAGANLRRRQLNKSQKAVAMAMIYPNAEKGGRGKKAETAEETSTVFSKKLLQQARAVLAFSQPLAQDVLKGTLSIDEALKTVTQERLRSEGAEAQMERLRKSAPDLADLVAEERMKLDEARAAAHQREMIRQDAYRAGVNAAAQISGWAGQVAIVVAGEQARGQFDPPIVIDKRHYDAAVEALVNLLKPFCREVTEKEQNHDTTQ
jgi:hypothetical protein